MTYALGVRAEDAVADVVAEGAEVGDVVVEPFELEQRLAGELAAALGRRITTGQLPPGTLVDPEALGTEF